MSLNTLPTLGFGTWRLPGRDCYDAVLDALALGYRHLDTAQMYGNEAEVGQAMRDSDVPRDQVWVTTKVTPQNLHPDGIRTSAQASLKRMGLDHVDLLLILWPVFQQAPLEELVRTMDEVRQRGDARFIGISNFNARQMARAAAVAPVLTNQVEYHPYLAQDTVRKACAETGMTLTAYCPLAQGQAVSDPVLAEIGEAHAASAAQVALAWLMGQDGVAVIPKAASHKNRVANLGALEVTLSDEDKTRVAGLARGLRLCDPPSVRPDWD